MRAGRAIPSLLATFAFLGLLAGASETPPARFTFVKVFPGSLPEYTAFSVTEDGGASYEGRSLKEPPQPESFRLPPDLVARLFTLAAELNHFRDIQVESARKIAQLGQKTFRYERAGEQWEVRFNHTENSTAAALHELCEKIARGRFFIGQLQHKLKYDRLGVLGTLREFERHFDKQGFVYPEQFVPVLTQVVEDSRVMRLAQSRAQRLLERIRGATAHIRYEQVSAEQNWYVAVSLREDGQGSYESRRLDAPSNPQPLEVSPRLRARVFELVERANYLRDFSASRSARNFAPGSRLTYERGAEYNQAVFVGPPTPNLAALTRLLSQIATQIEFRSRLGRALGQHLLELPGVLHDLDQAVNQQALAEPAEFAPVLEQVARGSNFYEEEQALARKILHKIRAVEAR